jgi:hypothetical protein
MLLNHYNLEISYSGMKILTKLFTVPGYIENRQTIRQL